MLRKGAAMILDLEKMVAGKIWNSIFLNTLP